MEIALQEAKNGINAGHGGPFGGVIVNNGEIVGRGHNEVIKRNDPTCHGEVMAIRDACRNLESFDLSDCELYTTAEPCPMCFGAILWANIRKVYYGCTIADTDKLGFRDEVFSTSSFDIKTEMDRKECLDLFEEYRSMDNKKGY